MNVTMVVPGHASSHHYDHPFHWNRAVVENQQYPLGSRASAAATWRPEMLKLKRQHGRERRDHFRSYPRRGCSSWHQNVELVSFCGGCRSHRQIHAVEVATEEPPLEQMTMIEEHRGRSFHHLRPSPRNVHHSNDVLCQQMLRAKTETDLHLGDEDMMQESVGGSGSADSGHAWIERMG